MTDESDIDPSETERIMFNVMRGYVEMPPLHFICMMCNIPSYLKSAPKDDMLYQCHNCKSYYVFRDIQDKGTKYEAVMRRVKFKTKEMELNWLKKNGVNIADFYQHEEKGKLNDGV